jgi:hypothetical protein
MDEQTIRRLMHQKRKDEYKVDALKLRKELENLDKQKSLNKFLKTMQYILIAMMMIVFVGIITTDQNAEISIGEKTLQMMQQKGWIE